MRIRSSSGGEIDTSKPGVTRHTAVKGNYSGARHDVGADDEPSGAVGRRRVGAGMGKKIGAKINTGKSKLMTKEEQEGKVNCPQAGSLCLSLLLPSYPRRSEEEEPVNQEL